MPYTIRPGIHAAAVGGNVVLLDIGKDRFYALPSTCIPAFRRFIEQADLTAEDALCLQQLAALDILESAPSWPEARAQAHLPDAAAFPILSACKAGPGLTLAAGLALLVARFQVRFRPFSEGLARLPASRNITSPARTCQAQASMIADAFSRCHYLLTKTDRCLSISLALTGMLRRHGIAATLVIGVETCPFASHSWVQLGRYVINDDPARTARFTPILVI